MVGITTILSFSALLSLTVADGEARRKDKGLHKVSPSTTLRTRDLSKRCSGTCEECFGSGYTQCPGSDYYCYLPGDTYYGIDSCTSGSTSAPEPTSTGSAGDSEICSAKGATCVTCFGAGYLSCPDNLYCYNPNDPQYDTCPDGGSTGGSSGTSSCADLYGTGNIKCGTQSCYNPDEGEVCCSNGHYCDSGETCSTVPGYCCSAGSTSSGCSGSGGGLLSSSSYSYTYTASATTATGTGLGSPSTGVAQFGDSSAAVTRTEVTVAGVVMGMFGVGFILFVFQLRRSALRVLSSSPLTYIPKPRAISSLAVLSIRTHPVTRTVVFQRRWASSEAEANKEDEEVPISELQPTPQEEVENAIHEDNAAAAEEGNAATTQATSELAEAADAADVSQSDPFSTNTAAPARDIRSARPPAEPKATVYIGNLFFDITESDLGNDFKQFGAIENIRIMRDSRGLSKGFAYIDFDTTESATSAINAMHQQLHEGRRLVVQYATFASKDVERKPRANKEPNPPSKTLFIGNMSFEMTDRDLNNLFRGIRNVIDVRVAIDRRTGQPRGFAHADFIDVKSAMEAMKLLQDKETYGRKLRIDYSYGPSTAPRSQTPPA